MSVNPDFAASVAAGLTESFEDYCKRAAPADFWEHLAHDQAAGRARRCQCGEENPGGYDVCHFCQRPQPEGPVS